MTKLMRAARLHALGEPLCVDMVPMPEMGPQDILVQVKAAGVVPSLRILANDRIGQRPFSPLPRLPAIFGLDAAGVVASVGKEVRADLAPGDRVYVNPRRSCGVCLACRRSEPAECRAFTFHYGGFGEYISAPESSLVKFGSGASYEEAARFGYLAVAYAALRKAHFSPGQSVLIDGATGTLGLSAVLVALAMGAANVFASGRNGSLLEKLRNIAPQHIAVVETGRDSLAAVVLGATDGHGVDAVIQAAGASTVLHSLQALRHGGRAIHIGGLAETVPIEPFELMHEQKSYAGSLWFTTAEGQRIADMVRAKTLNTEVLEHERFALTEVNEALDAMEQRCGGFTNLVIVH